MDGIERTIVFGFPPPGDRSEKRRDIEDVANSLSERSGVRIAATFAADYRRLVDDLVAGRIDVAWLGPLGVLRAGAHAIPVLIMQRAGRTRYQSAWIARRDAGIAGVADLARRCVGWVDEDSAAGYVFPRAVLAAHTADIDGFLGAQRILGSHRAVIEAVLNREVDAGATFVNYDDDGEIAAAGWYEHFPERKDELVPFATTSPIPHDMIVVRASLPQDDRDAIIGALHALGSDHEGQDLRMAVFNGAEAFTSIEPSLLDELAQLGTRAGWPGLTSS